MSSIGTPLYEKLARLIGEPTARTRFRKTKDICRARHSAQPPVREIGLSARHPT
jgi:hypothetical protein